MAFITSRDDVPLHCEIHGTGPVDLIFLHGWGGDGKTWNEMVKHLDATLFHAFCLDLRGHGQSGVPAAGYTIQHFTEDVLTVAEEAGARNFILVGFSMGGKLACHLAAKHPDRVSALVLVAPIGPGPAPVDRELGLHVCRQAGDWRQNEAVFKNWFAPDANDATIKTCCQTIARTPLPVLESTAELFLWTSFVSEVGTLSLPALVITGVADPVYGSVYQEKEMLPFLTRATMTTIPSGHFVPLEQPVELAREISQFVSKIPL